MGRNSSGQLGDGSYSDTNRPVSVASNVVAVAAGYYHSLFVQADGTLWAMGYNSSGQLGDGSNTSTNRPVSVASNVVAVAAGSAHSLFVQADGTLWAMGRNSSGQLGDGSYSDTNRPVSVASNVVAVAAGQLHSVYVQADGTLWAMGYNYEGELGDGSNNDTNRPVAVSGLLVASLGPLVPAFHSLAVAAVAPQAASLTNQTASVGQSFAFSVVVTNGDGPFTYQWQHSGTNLVGATDATYANASAQMSDAGTYMVAVTGMAGSTSVSATLTVNQAATTTTLTSSLNPSSFGASVTFTSTVSPSAATGTVTFKDGITTLGTGILSSGTASYTNSALAVGAHSITAEYAGDASYAASTSGVLTQTVTSLVANDATYQRAAGLPLRIRIADIAWDTTGKPVTLLSLGTSGRGATLTTNSTYIFYQPQPGQDFGDLFTYTVTNGSDTNTGTIYVVVPLVSGGIAKSITCSGGTVTIKFFGIPGERYDVERATSLVEPIQWETVSKGTLTPEADGSFIFTDPSPPQSGSAYYRSVQYVPAG
jgi:hypothetical protein